MAEDQEVTPTTISVEAHERVRTERDTLKQQVSDLSKVAQDAGRVNRAYEHFKGKEGFSGDAYGFALAAMRDINVRDAADDSFSPSLDSWLTGQQSMFNTPAPSSPDDVTVSAEEAEPATPAVSGPQPNADGGAVTKREKWTNQSPEWQALKEAGDFTAMKRAIQEGKVDLPGEHFQNIQKGR
jgi:hypothetical protein